MIQKRLQDTNMQIYVVKQGDTVDTIAGEYGVSVEDIIYDNQIPYPYRLAVGMALLLRITGEGCRSVRCICERLCLSVYQQLCAQPDPAIPVLLIHFFLWVYYGREPYSPGD